MGVITRHESAPATDIEWVVALEQYALDHDVSSPKSLDNPVESEAPMPIEQRSQSRPISPLIHAYGSSDSLDTFASDVNDQRRRLGSRTSSTSDTLNSSSSNDADRGGADGLHYQEDMVSYGAGGTAYKPRVFGPQQDKRTSDSERRRMRNFYEEEGWLPGPTASRATLEDRRKAIKRLGLSSIEGREARQAIIVRYADLAKSIFSASEVAVSILFEKHDQAFTSTSAELPSVDLSHSISAHTLHSWDGGAMIVADLSKDWRFAGNNTRGEFKFFASVPLLLCRDGCPTIAVGALSVYDNEPRDTFDKREEAMLLKLSNLLVYQLVTLHSEMMVKKSRKMCEETIGFLRRSLATPLPSSEGEIKRTKPREDNSTVQKQVVGSVQSHLSVKGKVKDVHTAKERAGFKDDQLFQDAATTVQTILKPDSVVIVSLEDFQLFARRTQSGVLQNDRIRRIDKERIIRDFTSGKPWPSRVEPVVVHTRPGTSLQILGQAGEGQYHFEKPNAGTAFGEVIRKYMKSRHFWWDRQETEDQTTTDFMALLPDEVKTALMATTMSADGALQFAILALWNKPPEEFGDYARVAVPFAWILGGSIMAALSVRRLRYVEQIQITYGNLQAHELRTPLHQILAMTQLLRTHLTEIIERPESHGLADITSAQQTRDVLPFLDGIETSGKVLHAIIDNILSFLDLKAKDNILMPSSAGLMNSPSNAAESIETMFETLINDACDEDKRNRNANGQPGSNVETIFEINPPLLGRMVTEDIGGALRKALSRILSNAYKFIDSQGCVEIYVQDTVSMRPPEACEDMAITKMISITIKDSGKGMEDAFVKEKLGDPWAKEDPYTAGSGLSVHLAWRIIDLMGGVMEISSTPGEGCTVKIDVPVPQIRISPPNSPEPTIDVQSNTFNTLSDAVEQAEIGSNQRRFAVAGYEVQSSATALWGLPRMGQVLRQSLTRLDCRITTLEDAEVIVVDGRMEEAAPSAGDLSLFNWFDRSKALDVVILVSDEHEAHPEILQREQELGIRIWRYRKPVTPSVLQAISTAGLVKSDSSTINTSYSWPNGVDEHRKLPPSAISGSVDSSPGRVIKHTSGGRDKSKLASNSLPINPITEEEVASLCLGDYAESRRQLEIMRPASGSSDSDPKTGLITPIHSATGSRGLGSDFATHVTTSSSGTSAVEAVPPVRRKVLVVEDNTINRKILVKILSLIPNIDVIEAGDGGDAVERFRALETSSIVLLDINMPVMDGFTAAAEMRAIEKRSKRPRSHIIAVTALATEKDMSRGLNECGMDQWYTKPCNKSTITSFVSQAIKRLSQDSC